MKYAIYGAGAIGSVLAARLMQSGEEVALIARGAHLEAIQNKGLLVKSRLFGDMLVRPEASEDPGDIGPVDAVLITVKAHGVPSIAPKIKLLTGPNTFIVPFQNGVPWWYFHGLGDKWEGWRVESVDPAGVISGNIDVRRVIAGIAYCSAHIAEPGVVVHPDSNRFPLGEPNGERTDRIQALAESFTKAGLKAALRTEIRHEIWVKLLGNVPFNPISALTRATLGEFLGYEPTRDLVRAIMDEVRAVAAGYGVKIGITSERRIEGARKVGAHKTSMLQDLEAGRRPELEPIVGAVIELAEKVDVDVPNIRTVYALAKLLMDPAARSPASV
jgi:2-dehydropantoate 2-reductase